MHFFADLSKNVNSWVQNIKVRIKKYLYLPFADWIPAVICSYRCPACNHNINTQGSLRVNGKLYQQLVLIQQIQHNYNVQRLVITAFYPMNKKRWSQEVVFRQIKCLVKAMFEGTSWKRRGDLQTVKSWKLKASLLITEGLNFASPFLTSVQSQV